MDLKVTANGMLVGTLISGRLGYCSCVKAQICIAEWSHHC